ncbi:MAG: class I SAM-dependent methyltransferase [Anaerolineaceae bacterium]|nr:class I SAM-dependent methyltransferase [Anaerolineaceae bacterium]
MSDIGQKQACILCGCSDLIHILDWTDRYNQPVSLHVCSKCGLRQLFPRKNDRDLEEFYASCYYISYSMDKKAKNVRWIKRKIAIAKGILDFIENFRPLKGLRLLDVGAGHGFLLREARNRGALVSGVEPSVRHAGRLRVDGFDVQTGSVEQFLSERKDVFDVVVLSHVLEHIGSPKTFLITVRRMLSDGGIICVEVPNAYWQTRFGRHPISIHTAHLCYYTEKTLKAILEISGLTVFSTSFGLHGGSVRVVGEKGSAKEINELTLDDPYEIKWETLASFRRHTAFPPLKQIMYGIRLLRKAKVKLYFKSRWLFKRMYW